MLVSAQKARSAIVAVSALTILSCLASIAHSQTRTPNPDAPAVLRWWPQTGGWATLLSRSDSHTLVCSMLTGKFSSGQVQYLATLARYPTEWHLGIADMNQISGNQISLVVDGVRVGDYPILKRQDNAGPLHSVRAILPSADTMRVMNLFRTGATVQFVTDQLTYTFPLAGAAQSLANVQSCIVEANSLTQTKTSDR